MDLYTQYPIIRNGDLGPPVEFLKISRNLDTVFPRIVSAETIVFWKLECGNYSREETI